MARGDTCRYSLQSVKNEYLSKGSEVLFILDYMKRATQGSGIPLSSPFHNLGKRIAGVAIKFELLIKRYKNFNYYISLQTKLR